MNTHLFSFLCVVFLIVLNVKCYYYEEQKPIYLTASVGDYVIFNCNVDFPQSIPIPYMLNWKKDGKTIYSWYNGVITSMDPFVGRVDLLNPLNHAERRYGRGSVNLTSIRDSDGGWYECQVLFPNRTPSSRNNGTWFHLTVNGGNLLAIPPINQTTLEGDEAKFVCLAKDPELKVYWYKDGIPLREYQDLMQRSYVTKENTLVISPTDMGDLGEYECEVRNVDGEKQTAKAFLNVQYKAKVIFAPPEIHLPYGRPALIDCHFRANPPLTNLRWEKDGFLFDPYNIQGVFYRRNGSLYFTKVDETHSGRYTCTPFNDLGTQGPSPPILVTVQRPPIFIITPHNLYLRKLGETIEMPCDARDGENGHKPIIVWYKKDGTSLPVGRYSIRDGNLTIINIQEEDRGLYQCSATNKAATITAETELLVENIPSNAPTNLTAISSSSSVHLTWAPGRQKSNVEYSVWYKAVEGSDWKTHQVLSSRTLEATITGLNSGREYEFMVLCKDDNGDGLFSKSVRVWTKGLDGETDKFRGNSFPPVGYPRNISVYQTENGFMVTWEAPEYGKENLKFYIVRWFQGPEDYLFGSAETRNTSYLLTSLSEGVEYNIQVVAVSFDDQQSVSERITLLVPGYKKIRAVSTGIITGFAFLVVAFVGVYYARKKWCSSYSKNVKGSK
ncbi:Protein turtle-like Protein [Tribolium castaneum]|uniref:Protein turtle-like Protein n=2 Tax=Tribolium castaneum TaxID=7070 RepID=A0A139WJC8_TRICA|nr:PREDICTED: protein turtle [Tribolium castaneum]KYB28100.1 Protein turtle-like Protein [Tribolium castaneum]|eukprot:XP_008192595.1 PREDICTED: protein turtle [Tribolium castaneum]